MVKEISVSTDVTVEKVKGDRFEVSFTGNHPGDVVSVIMPFEKANELRQQLREKLGNYLQDLAEDLTNDV